MLLVSSLMVFDICDIMNHHAITPTYIPNRYIFMPVTNGGQ